MPTEFEQQCLDAHNQRRKEHGVPPLKLNSGLCAKAQEWAKHMTTNGFKHRTDRNLDGQIMGENIAYKYDSRPTDYTGAEVTESWYSEIKDYNFNTHKSDGGPTGHFTQVVWKDSTELGVGKATDGKGKWYAVANYLPAGNMGGRYAQNVFPHASGGKPNPAPAKSPAAKSADDLSAKMNQMTVKEKKQTVDHGGKQVVGTSTKTSTNTSIVNGTKTVTTITEITYKYSDGSTSKEITEKVETS